MLIKNQYLISIFYCRFDLAGMLAIWTDAYTNFKRTLTDALVGDDKSKRTSKLQEHYGLLKSEKTEEKLNKGETPSEEVRTVLKDYICV